MRIQAKLILQAHADKCTSSLGSIRQVRQAKVSHGLNACRKWLDAAPFALPGVAQHLIRCRQLLELLGGIGIAWILRVTA